VDYLLNRGVTCVCVLDISSVALQRAQRRLGAQGHDVTWIEADVTEEWPVPSVDIWHDRAVFHFLTEPSDRTKYVAQLKAAVRRGGTVIVATFGPDGPLKCSGLPVVRYSPDQLSTELGPGFELQQSVSEQHHTPFGTTQAFCYSRFRRSI
jgi:SAM-dependent methyltransferase